MPSWEAIANIACNAFVAFDPDEEVRDAAAGVIIERLMRGVKESESGAQADDTAVLVARFGGERAASGGAHEPTSVAA